MDNSSSLLKTREVEALDCLSPDALRELLKVYQAGYAHAVSVNTKLARENDDLRCRLQIEGTQCLLLAEQLVVIRHEKFGRSSERSEKEVTELQTPRRAKSKPQLPSARFPDAEVIESRFDFKNIPECRCCQNAMQAMGQQEVSEEVDVVPRKFFIRRIMREKYRCPKCQSHIATAPGPVKLIAGGSYSAGFAVEIAEQKYSHHVPIERLKKQFERQGLSGIEAPTLIEQTHHLAEQMRGVYRAIKNEIQSSSLIHADETTWRMLEGSKKSSWYLWGYGCERGVFYQAKDNRSSDSPGKFLADSRAKFLMVDGYTGYAKAVREEKPELEIAHCWAHARRKFTEAEKVDSRATAALKWINELYILEKGLSEAERAMVRNTQSREIVTNLREWTFNQNALPKSSLGKALDYLLRYWAGLVRFLEHPEIPLDNNFAERALRGPVLGRKNFYGNHSVRGAETSAILYTVSESCKLAGVPFAQFVRTVLQTSKNITPYQYSIT